MEKQVAVVGSAGATVYDSAKRIARSGSLRPQTALTIGNHGMSFNGKGDPILMVEAFDCDSNEFIGWIEFHSVETYNPQQTKSPDK